MYNTNIAEVTYSNIDPNLEFFDSLADFISGKLDYVSAAKKNFIETFGNAVNELTSFSPFGSKIQIDSDTLAEVIVYRPIGFTGYMSKYADFITSSVNELHDIDTRLMEPLYKRLAMVISSPENAGIVWNDRKLSFVNIEPIIKKFQGFYVKKKNDSGVIDGVYFKELYLSAKDFEDTSKAMNDMSSAVKAINLNKIKDTEAKLMSALDAYINAHKDNDHVFVATRKEIEQITSTVNAIINELELLTMLIHSAVVANNAYKDSASKLKKL